MEPDSPHDGVDALLEVFRIMGSESNLLSAILPTDPVAGLSDRSSSLWRLINEYTEARSVQIPTDQNETVCEIINRMQELSVYYIYVYVESVGGSMDVGIANIATRGDECEHVEIARFLTERESAILARFYEHRYDADNSEEEGLFVGISGHWHWNMGDDTVWRIACPPPWYKPLVTTEDIAMRETRLRFPTDEIMAHFVNVFHTVLLIGEDNIVMVEDLDNNTLRIMHKTTYSPQNVVLQELQYQRTGADWCMFNEKWNAHQVVHGLD
jgi:hypothetical protein